MNNINNHSIIGLTDKQVIESREKYGNNEITSKKQEGFFRLLIEALGDPIIKILLIALGIKLVFLIRDFDWFETIGIVIAILVASFISTISEYGSEKAFAKLQAESAKIKCRVKRNGKIVEINIDDVVVGDIVELQAGDKIPADGHLIYGNISVDESSLNGETKEVFKEAVNSFNGNIEDRNIVYRGTVVYSKEAFMIVTKIGNNTFYGKLASELQEKQPESPLKSRLRQLAKVISRIGYVGAFLVSFSYLFSVIFIANDFNMLKISNMLSNFPIIFGHILYALTLCVTVIVVAVPEGLPMMITLVLSSNMKRMLKDNVLVRKLVGIETAGSINILFSDKTGTLTKGKLEVVGVMDSNLREYKSLSDLMKQKELYNLMNLSMVYNNASSYDDKKEVIGGNITDQALLKFIKSETDNNIRIISTIPFDSKNKYSITVVNNGQKLGLIKGAPERILPYCNYYYNEVNKKLPLFNKNKLNSKLEEVTKKGIRVLVLAINDDYHDITSIKNLILVGFVFIKDEIRPEAIEGINLVTNAHIQTVMITGDNKDTAIAIASEIGLLNDPDDIVLTSYELNKKSDEEIKEILPHLKVVARSLPQDKSRLVRVCQEMNLVVGMTGDGVNDAPALKKADVGFAMGSGTEVSKEASDVVILDDNFLSISKAILFGRTIFKSIRKFIILQLTINLCAISLSIVGPFIGIDTPVTVIQMLWVNMIMDTLAGLAFAFEPPLREYMKELPKKKNEPIINKYMRDQILFTGFYSAILCILFLKLPIIHSMFRSDPSNIYIMTAFFGLFIFIDIFNCFNARTHRLNLLANIFNNKVFIVIMILIVIIQTLLIYFGGSIFRTAGLTFDEFKIMIILAATVIPVDWMRKIYLRTKGLKGGV